MQNITKISWSAKKNFLSSFTLTVNVPYIIRRSISLQLKVTVPNVRRSHQGRSQDFQLRGAGRA